MNFVELTNDLYSNLTSSHYLDSLWSKIREESTSISATLEDYEIYRNHLPLDLKKYLKQCNTKLRDMKDVSDNEAWQILNERYISTFVYFILEEEDTSMDNALYAANIFILLNTMTIPEKQMFYKVTYLKILEILNDFNNSGEIGSNIIMFLMDDFKTMLSKINLPHETITSTVAVLHTFTYSCNEEFQQINTEISFESLGYIAFVSLKILAEKLIHQKKYLYPIILCLMSSLKSAPIGNLHANAKKNHQKMQFCLLKVIVVFSILETLV